MGVGRESAWPQISHMADDTFIANGMDRPCSCPEPLTQSVFGPVKSTRSRHHAAAAYSIAIDTGKNVLHVIGPDEKGAVVLCERVSRSRIAARLVNVPRCQAGMATHYAPTALDVAIVPETRPSGSWRRLGRPCRNGLA